MLAFLECHQLIFVTLCPRTTWVPYLLRAGWLTCPRYQKNADYRGRESLGIIRQASLLPAYTTNGIHNQLPDNSDVSWVGLQSRSVDWIKVIIKELDAINVLWTPGWFTIQYVQDQQTAADWPIQDVQRTFRCQWYFQEVGGRNSNPHSLHPPSTALVGHWYSTDDVSPSSFTIVDNRRT